MEIRSLFNLFLRFLSGVLGGTACLGRPILGPARATHGANARRLANVLKAWIRHRTEAKGGHVGARNAPRFTLDDIDNAGGGIDRQPTGPHNAVFQARRLPDDGLLVVLVLENLFHGRPHEDLEKEWRLIFAVAGTDARHNSQALDTLLLHGGNDIAGPVRQHGVAYIGRLATESDNDAVNRLARKDLVDIGSLRHVAGDHGQLGIRQWLVRVGSTRSLGDDQIGWVSAFVSIGRGKNKRALENEPNKR